MKILNHFQQKPNVVISFKELLTKTLFSNQWMSNNYHVTFLLSLSDSYTPIDSKFRFSPISPFGWDASCEIHPWEQCWIVGSLAKCMLLRWANQVGWNLKRKGGQSSGINKEKSFSHAIMLIMYARMPTHWKYLILVIIHHWKTWGTEIVSLQHLTKHTKCRFKVRNEM